MKKFSTIITTLLLIVALLTGCNGANPPDGNNSEPSNTTDFDTKPIVEESELSNASIRQLRVERKVSDTSVEERGQGKYIYAIMNIPAMSQGDLTAVGNYLAKIVEANVLVSDSSKFTTAPELYAEICKDHQTRGGEIVGVQIFGNADMVPAFEIDYRVQMQNSVDEKETFLTDLFYGNLNNDPAKLNTQYNVLDHFANDWDIDLIPQWRVVRLPLSKGQFANFFTRYDNFVKTTQFSNPDIVSFSSPIFASPRHIDDVGAFLERTDKELGVLKIPYRLYANLDGDYPVENPNVLGNMIPDNLAKENDSGIAEFIINGHGESDYIIRTIYQDGKSYREYLINKQTINRVLDNNAYYMDTWSCYVGYGMKNNLTTTALTGKCVGVFSSTTIMANNGADRTASIADMEGSNFFYFYYTYLKTLSDGSTRSEAFLAAQQAYGNALIEDSKNEIEWGSNYQFNLYNLLAYHNFGVLEPNSDIVTEAKGYIVD